MPKIDAPDPIARQVSGFDPDGRPILAVLFKQTFRVLPDGRLDVAEPVPLAEDLRGDPDTGRLLQDTDLYPHKLATDMVVRGHAHAPGSRPRARFEAAVRIGPHAKVLLVLGDRFCTSAGGRTVFSDPMPVEKVPLAYTHAYGGRDAVAEAKYGNPYLAYQSFMVGLNWDLSQASPFLYPRNPFGSGYLVEASTDGLERLVLPNLEDPLDPLTPERIAAGEPGNWVKMPLPHCTDWVDYCCFPRIAYAGLVPLTEPDVGVPAEAVRGFAPADILDDKPIHEQVSLRMANGASLGMQLPYLRGGETVALENMHPTQGKLVVRLPADRPRMWVDGRKGTLKETDPVIHTVVIEPDEGRLTVVWRGSAPALRPYMTEELQKMPFKIEC
jgi:hypothetical protein